MLRAMQTTENTETTMAGRFEGKVALVTGGASGIGAATARRLAREGAKLMIGDIDAAGAQAVAEELGDAGAFVLTDVRQMAQVEALTEAAVERFGRLDIVFNNAGSGLLGETPDVDPEAWRNLFELDVHSVFYGCRAAIPHLRRAGGGVIVNTASISGLMADPGLATYNAAKGAVVNYTRSLAVDHARDNIRANAVCPGPIETPLLAPVLQLPGVRDEYARLVPMGRVGKPEEVAGVVAFLASDDAAYITGASIVIDGGVTACTGQPSFTRIVEELMGRG
jgi:meso-butanediol dehydrogenase/(S,S)-butanediol dehydrogenase/diacetyl reductase